MDPIEKRSSNVSEAGSITDDSISIEMLSMFLRRGLIVNLSSDSGIYLDSSSSRSCETLYSCSLNMKVPSYSTRLTMYLPSPPSVREIYIISVGLSVVLLRFNVTKITLLEYWRSVISIWSYWSSPSSIFCLIILVKLVLVGCTKYSQPRSRGKIVSS